ncbi:tatD family hydrolase [Bacteroides sp. CAG:927]|jgi:hypothetical protein BACCOPRO_02435|nr:tatD family hydrolase [Bacteroides sp. CAG:927]
MIIDTHTHLYLPEFDNGGVPAVRRAVDAGVAEMIFPNVDLTTIAPMKALHEQFPSITHMAMGLHPTEIGEDWREQLAAVREHWLDGTQHVAVGEVGIDLYWDATFAEQQMMALEQQLQWAVDSAKPVIIHCRNGLDQTLEVLQGFHDITGVMHSFGGTDRDVDRVRSVADLYFGINGIVTFKNSKLRHTLPAITTSRLLVETDAPYLAPVPYRGKQCESAMLPATVAHIADTLGLPVSEVERVTTANARTLFSLPH